MKILNLKTEGQKLISRAIGMSSRDAQTIAEREFSNFPAFKFSFTLPS